MGNIYVDFIPARYRLSSCQRGRVKRIPWSEWDHQIMICFKAILLNKCSDLIYVRLKNMCAILKKTWARGLPHYNASSVLGLGPTPRISLAAKFEYFPRRNFDWVRRCNFGHRHPLCFGILQTICGRQLSNLCSLVGAPFGIIFLL